MDEDTEKVDAKEREVERRILMLDVSGFICASGGVVALGAAFYGMNDHAVYWQMLLAVVLLFVASRSWKKAKELVEARALVLEKTLPQFPKEEDEVDEDPPSPQ